MAAAAAAVFPCRSQFSERKFAFLDCLLTESGREISIGRQRMGGAASFSTLHLNASDRGATRPANNNSLVFRPFASMSQDLARPRRRSKRRSRSPRLPKRLDLVILTLDWNTNNDRAILMGKQTMGPTLSGPFFLSTRREEKTCRSRAREATC